MEKEGMEGKRKEGKGIEKKIQNNKRDSNLKRELKKTTTQIGKIPVQVIRV